MVDLDGLWDSTRTANESSRRVLETCVTLLSTSEETTLTIGAVVNIAMAPLSFAMANYFRLL